MAKGERRTFRAKSAPRWVLLYLLVDWLVLIWPSHHGVRSDPVLHGMMAISLLVLILVVIVRWRQATTVSWTGVTVRSVFLTKRYGWAHAYCFECRERSVLGRWTQTRAALRLTDGTLVPLTPRWSGYRERQLVDDIHEAAVWFRRSENRLALQAWMREHPPKFHPLIAGRSVGPMLVGIGLTSLAIAAAFPFPVVHPHRKLDLKHQLDSTVPHHLAHATGWVEGAAIIGVAMGVIGLLVAVRNVGRMSEPISVENDSGLITTATRSGNVAAMVVSGAAVLLAAPVWFWVLVQGLPPQLGVVAVGAFAASAVFSLGLAAILASRGHSRGERFSLRGYMQWHNALQ